ncbi:MAG: hypothetical protein WC804_13885 [Sphingomonas sp.]|uniref:hypothetical protein n=1 Tax=Sphingomonas sp. TaxID=28214 RepID=UPI00356AEF6D
MRLLFAFAHSFPWFEKQCGGLYANCAQQSMVWREASSIPFGQAEPGTAFGNAYLAIALATGHLRRAPGGAPRQDLNNAHCTPRGIDYSCSRKARGVTCCES